VDSTGLFLGWIRVYHLDKVEEGYKGIVYEVEDDDFYEGTCRRGIVLTFDPENPRETVE
jgi:hypothetical protein